MTDWIKIFWSAKIFDLKKLKSWDYSVPGTCTEYTYGQSKFSFVRSNFEKFYLLFHPLLLPLGLYRAMVSTVAWYSWIFPTDEHVVSIFSILIPGKKKSNFSFVRFILTFCSPFLPLLLPLGPYRALVSTVAQYLIIGKYCCSILNNW